MSPILTRQFLGTMKSTKDMKGNRHECASLQIFMLFMPFMVPIHSYP